MGANAVTSVYDYTAGQILTAQQVDNLNCGIPVFATTTTRDAAFGGTGEKTLAQGQYAFIEANSALMVYTGSAWINAGTGLTYITSATPSAVQTVSVNNCFTSAFTSYLIMGNFTASVGADATMTVRMRLSGTDATTNYTGNRLSYYSTTVAAQTRSDLWFGEIDASNPTQGFYQMTINNPAVAVATVVQATGNNLTSAGTLRVSNIATGIHSTATAYDGFTLITSGTSFTGNIRVYGYQNS